MAFPANAIGLGAAASAGYIIAQCYDKSSATKEYMAVAVLVALAIYFGMVKS